VDAFDKGIGGAQQAPGFIYRDDGCIIANTLEDVSGGDGGQTGNSINEAKLT
jgi:hypothetical protein